jgi:hypothetical protein
LANVTAASVTIDGGNLNFSANVATASVTIANGDITLVP